MMNCAKCGEAFSMTNQSGGIDSGPFMERYECANGHIGFISGEAGTDPDAWEHRGQVFEA